jgi:hypothetical protein
MDSIAAKGMYKCKTDTYGKNIGDAWPQLGLIELSIPPLALHIYPSVHCNIKH